MPYILHWAIREQILNFRTEGVGREARYPILTELILYAHGHTLRTHISVERIKANTGYREQAVAAALAWLSERYAIFNIPQEARTGKEQVINRRRSVWQLTGTIYLGGKYVPYVLMGSSIKQMIIDSLTQIGGEALEFAAAMSFTDNGPGNFNSSETDNAEKFTSVKFTDESSTDKKNKKIYPPNDGVIFFKSESTQHGSNGSSNEDSTKSSLENKKIEDPLFTPLAQKIQEIFPDFHLSQDDLRRLDARPKGTQHRSPNTLYAEGEYFPQFVTARLKQFKAMKNKPNNPGQVTIPRIISNLLNYEYVNEAQPAWSGFFAFRAKQLNRVEQSRPKTDAEVLAGIDLTHASSPGNPYEKYYVADDAAGVG